MIATVLSFTGLAGWLGAAAVARHRAQGAADLAAYSAAVRLLAGPDAACATARAIAEAMHATISECRIDNLDVTVSVAVPMRVPWSPGPARAVARAGPAGGFTPE